MTSVILKNTNNCDIIIVVIKMKQTENFVQDSILLISLTLAAVFTSFAPYIILLLCGILMFVITIRSLSDKPNRLLIMMQIATSAVFSVISGMFSPYLVFYICRTKKEFQIILPAIFYIIVQTISDERSLPEILCGGLFLLSTAALISFAERLTVGYLAAKDQIAKSVSVTAVNEMYERKLNRELVIKNYLADKNVRLEERENISRNIHNSVGHSITAAIMTLDAADMLFDTAPNIAREKMNAANERIRGSLSSIRHAVRVLDGESKFVAVNDLISELTAVIDSFVMDTMIKIHTDFTNTDTELTIPHEHTEFLTGAAQELLSNGVRHGNADMFTVRVTADSGHIRLSVADNGKSDFSALNSRERIENGFGLKKLISYAKRCGGTAVFENENGFRSEITLPLYWEGEHG